MGRVTIPQGGYDTSIVYRLVHIREVEIIRVGDQPHGSYKQYRMRTASEHPWVNLDTTEGPLVPTPDPFTTLYAHQQVMRVWHSDHVEIDDTLPAVIDYGWERAYIATVWTTNAVEKGDQSCP